MKPVEFLQSELQKIAKEFKQVYIKYGYNEVIYTHIVELLPLSEYQNNNALDDAWIPLSFEFRTKFPDEEIAFISSDSKLRLSQVELEFNVPTVESVISKVFKAFGQRELRYTFPTSIPYQEGIVIDTDLVRELLQYPKQRLSPVDSDFDASYLAAA